MAKNMLTDSFSEPLSDVTSANVDIHAGTANLSLGPLAGTGQVLAAGTLQYLAEQDRPVRNLASSDGRATLTLRAGNTGHSRFRFPWSVCKGATDWQIRLNPAVASDITAHSDGGNITLNLAGMSVTGVSAHTGGGNMDVLLPDHAADLGVTAKTGAGNVTLAIGSGLTGNHIVNAESGAGNVIVRIPSGTAARINATSGLGKVTVDPEFSKTGDKTYQSIGFDSAADKVEITISSGAGNVSVTIK